MKANELRVGNYFDLYGQVAQMIPNDFEKWFDAKWKCTAFNPIPLTEEWLLKFGFECHQVENESRTYFYSKTWGINGVEIICADYHYKGEFEYQIAKARYKLVKYVHQLQNLYFALTGTELTIKS